MNAKYLYIATLLTLALTGCASRRPTGQAALQPGVRYTAPLGAGLTAEVKADKKSNTIDIYIIRKREVVAQFGASEHLVTSQMVLDAEHGERTVNISVSGGRIVQHTLVNEDDRVYQRISDRDGDFFPDERITYDKVAEKKTRQIITHDFAPFPESK